MINTIDYYFAPTSGYTYLGHDRLIKIANRFEVQIRFFPVDIERVYLASQTVPPARQSECRKNYRILDMQRCADEQKLPINTTPQYWSVKSDLACRAILAAKALQFDIAIVCKTIFQGVWVLEENISEEYSLIKLLNSVELPGRRIISRADKGSVHRQALEITQQAIDKGVFGSPTYEFNDSLYWGQDRLNQLTRTLANRKSNVAIPETDAELI